MSRGSSHRGSAARHPVGVSEPSVPYEFDRDRWAARVRAAMFRHEKSTRDVEVEAEVSKATVSRVSREGGDAWPDVETYLRLNRWMAEVGGAEPACPNCGAPADSCCASFAADREAFAALTGEQK